MTYSALWELNQLTKSVKENPTERPDANVVSSIKGKVNELISDLKNYFTTEDNSEELKYHSFLKLLDLFSMFSARLRTTILHELAFSITPALQQSIVDYFESQLNDLNNSTSEALDSSRLQDAEKIKDKKRKIIYAIVRATTLQIIQPVSIGPKILSNLLKHNDKKIDEIIKIFYTTLRNQKYPGEAKIIYTSIVNVCISILSLSLLSLFPLPLPLFFLLSFCSIPSCFPCPFPSSYLSFLFTFSSILAFFTPSLSYFGTFPLSLP